MKILIVGTERYSINMCDFDMFFRNSDHEIVQVLPHRATTMKGWFRSGKYTGSTRNNLVSKLRDHKCEPWSCMEGLLKRIRKVDFDYLCLGNGNDETGKMLQKQLKCKFLFSEYGWLPWNQCFYIDPKGTGPLASFKQSDIVKMKITKTAKKEMECIKNSLDVGSPVPYKDFVYVPLQVDRFGDGRPDFKFQFTSFKNNIEFLNYVKSIVPKDVTILAKNHPTAPRKTIIPEGIVDISSCGYNKRLIYENMLGMLCINSTSALEGLLFNKLVFTFGKDIFSNKSLTIEDVSKEDLEVLLNRNSNMPNNAEKFIALLLQRQVYRHCCKDEDYVKSHYWNTSL